MCVLSFVYGMPGSGKTLTTLKAIDDVVSGGGNRCFFLYDIDESSKFDKYKRDFVFQKWHNLETAFLRQSENEKKKVLVIDSLTKMLFLAEKRVCRDEKVDHIDALPYGKGAKMVAQNIISFLEKCAGVFDNIIIIGHASYQDATKKITKTVVCNKILLEHMVCTFDNIGFYTNGYVYFDKKISPLLKTRAFSGDKSVCVSDLILL